jgi:hypothetical protein
LPVHRTDGVKTHYIRADKIVSELELASQKALFCTAK